MITLLSQFESHFQSFLTPTQFQTLSILISLINQYREVKIEKLATYFPLPIQFESRRKHIQRFLVLAALSIPLIWFPIISLIITQQFSLNSSLIIALDRTQWQDKNIFIITVIWCGHAWPIYWTIFEKKGSSNLQEQKAHRPRRGFLGVRTEQEALIRPVIKLLNKYHIIIIGDREFHSIELATWLKKEKKKGKRLDFAFRQKQGSFYHKGGGKYVPLSEIEIDKGVKQIKMGIKVTKKKGFSSNNLAIYHKRKKLNKGSKEPWYILTSLNNKK